MHHDSPRRDFMCVCPAFWHSSTMSSHINVMLKSHATELKKKLKKNLILFKASDFVLGHTYSWPTVCREHEVTRNRGKYKRKCKLGRRPRKRNLYLPSCLEEFESFSVWWHVKRTQDTKWKESVTSENHKMWSCTNVTGGGGHSRRT